MSYTPFGYDAVFVNPANVREGVNRGDEVLGTLAVPNPATVLLNTPTDATVGQLVLPPGSDVRQGLVYGTGGNGGLGQLRVPAPNAVQAGVQTDNTVGTFVVPGAQDVRNAVIYGPNGSLVGLLYGVTPPASPGLVTALAYLRNGRDQPLAGEIVYFRLVSPGVESGVWTRKDLQATSGVDGGIEVQLLRSSRYQVRLENGIWQEFVTPDADSYELPLVLGPQSR